MSIEKPSEISEALESKTRFKGFHIDAPDALNLVNKRIDKEIQDRINDVDAEQTRAEEAEKQLQSNIDAEVSARTTADSQLSADITELGNTINEQIQSINTDIDSINTKLTDLESRVSALENPTGGQ